MFAEPFPPQGGIDARSVRRALGTFSMDFWQLFLRETLQNSWDARIGSGQRATYTVDGWQLEHGQLEALRLLLPTTDGYGGELAETLESHSVSVLTVTDQGTRGLSGPTRADLFTDGRRDFVDLIRNIGRHPDKGVGAGTYGYGKAVLFEASRCGTVIVFTRTTVDRRLVTRLIGMSLTDPYTVAGRQYTGRHWWGRPDPQVGVEPVTDVEAERTATALGMHRLRPGTCGTSIMIIAPRDAAADGTDGLAEIVATIAEAATSYAWANMISDGGPAPLTVEFTCDGRCVEAPDPANDPRLRHFVEAFLRCRRLLNGRPAEPDSWPWHSQEIVGSRPQRRLGAIAWCTHRSPVDGSHAQPPAEIVLMRNPRLVVEYRSVTPDPAGQAISGVFIADPTLDAEFGMAEPPAHDKWEPRRAQRERYARNPVSQALKRIDQIFSDRRTAAAADAVESTDSTGVARLASLLGSILDGQPDGTDARIPDHDDEQVRPGGDRWLGSVNTYSSPGSDLRRDAGSGPAAATDGDQQMPEDQRGPIRTATGLEPIEPRPPRPPARGRIGVSFHQRARLGELADGTPCTTFDIDLNLRSLVGTAVLIAEPLLAVADGPAGPPDDSTPVEVVGWIDRGTGAFLPGDRLTLRPDATGTWSVQLTQPPDAAVTLRIRQDRSPS